MDPITIRGRVTALSYNEGSNSFTVRIALKATGRHAVLGDEIHVVCPPSGFALPALPSNVEIKISPEASAEDAP